jgi:hypothetical protein
MVIFINRGALFCQDSIFPITFFTVCISDELDEISLFSEENFLSGVRRYRLNSPSFSWAVLSKNKNK